MSNNICNLPDMQKSTEGFNKIPLKKVGMRNVELPVKIWQSAENRFIDVHAKFSSYCNLVPSVKGINMSRITRTLIDVVKKYQHMDTDTMLKETIPGYSLMDEFAENLMEAHTSDNKESPNTDHVYVKMEFDYPYWTKTPASDLDSAEYVTVIFETVRVGSENRRFMTVKNAGLSLCPCSREMSLLYSNINESEKSALDQLPAELQAKLKLAGFGAHNQRSYVDITVEFPCNLNPLFIEDIIELADKSFSCPTKTVLKRPDEKVVTETPYAGGYFVEKDGDFEFIKVEGTGAKFVEDIARDCAGLLDEHMDNEIIDYVVVVNNQESIHSRNIDAVAVVTAGRNLA